MGKLGCWHPERQRRRVLINLYQCGHRVQSQGGLAHFQASCSEGSRKDDLLGCLGDVNEPSTAGLPPRKAVHVDIAFLVNLHPPTPTPLTPIKPLHTGPYVYKRHVRHDSFSYSAWGELNNGSNKPIAMENLPCQSRGLSWSFRLQRAGVLFKPGAGHANCTSAAPRQVMSTPPPL